MKPFREFEILWVELGNAHLWCSALFQSRYQEPFHIIIIFSRSLFSIFHLIFRNSCSDPCWLSSHPQAIVNKNSLFDFCQFFTLHELFGDPCWLSPPTQRWCIIVKPFSLFYFCQFVTEHQLFGDHCWLSPFQPQMSMVKQNSRFEFVSIFHWTQIVLWSLLTFPPSSLLLTFSPNPASSEWVSVWWNFLLRQRSTEA